MRFRATFWGLRDNIRCSSLAHWKARSGLPVSVKWTFFARCYGWGATSEYRLKIGDFASTRSLWPKISSRRDRPPPTIFSPKTRLNHLSYGIKKFGLIVLRFVTIHAFDRRTGGQTDWRTEFLSLHRVFIPCSAVKTALCKDATLQIDRYSYFICIAPITWRVTRRFSCQKDVLSEIV